MTLVIGIGKRLPTPFKLQQEFKPTVATAKTNSTLPNPKRKRRSTVGSTELVGRYLQIFAPSQSLGMVANILCCLQPPTRNEQTQKNNTN